MTFPTTQERLAEILKVGFSGKGLELVQINLELVQINTDTGKMDFDGKRGWLRYQSDLQHSDCLKLRDETKCGRPLAGDWLLHKEPRATARLTIEKGAQTVRVIEEKPLGENGQIEKDWLPALCEIIEVSTRPVDDRGAGRMKHAVYYGFRNETEASEGNLRRLCERMIAWEALPTEKLKKEDE